MMRQRISCGTAAVLVLGAVALAPLPARGAPLEPSACAELQARLDGLRQDGVEADMAIGPEAARTRLPIERFNRIGTYIEIEEQLNFRCGLGKQRIVLPTTVEGGEEEIPAPGEAAPGPAATPKAPAAVKGAAVGKEAAPAEVAKEKTPAKAKAPAAKSPQAAKDQAAKEKDAAGAPAKSPKKKAPAKKKPAAEVDDAYRPPPRWRTVVREGNDAPPVKQ